MAGRRYLEDLTVGEKQVSSKHLVTEEDALAFSHSFDPQPMHIDKDAAEKGMFGGLIASGWHTAALAMRMMAEVKTFGDSDVLGLGVDNLSWPIPVRPGDTLQGEVEIAEIRPSRSNPRFGIVKMNCTVRNQHGEVVLRLSPNCWIERRPA
jgi:acyl dehydratase